MSNQSPPERMYTALNNLYIHASEVCAAWEALDEDIPEENVLKDRFTRFYPKSLAGSFDDITHDIRLWSNIVQKRKSRHRRTLPFAIEAMREVAIKNLCAVSSVPKGLLPCSVYVEDTENDKPMYKEYKLLSIIPQSMTCILQDPETEMEEEAELADINIDWLVTVWERCQILSAKKQVE